MIIIYMLKLFKIFEKPKESGVSRKVGVLIILNYAKNNIT